MLETPQSPVAFGIALQASDLPRPVPIKPLASSVPPERQDETVRPGGGDISPTHDFGNKFVIDSRSIRRGQLPLRMGGSCSAVSHYKRVVTRPKTRNPNSPGVKFRSDPGTVRGSRCPFSAFIVLFSVTVYV